MGGVLAGKGRVITLYRGCSGREGRPRLLVAFAHVEGSPMAYPLQDARRTGCSTTFPCPLKPCAPFMRTITNSLCLSSSHSVKPDSDLIYPLNEFYQQAALPLPSAS